MASLWAALKELEVTSFTGTPCITEWRQLTSPTTFPTAGRYRPHLLGVSASLHADLMPAAARL
jgi:hypothetical protein